MICLYCRGEWICNGTHKNYAFWVRVRLMPASNQESLSRWAEKVKVVKLLILREVSGYRMSHKEDLGLFLRLLSTMRAPTRSDLPFGGD